MYFIGAYISLSGTTGESSGDENAKLTPGGIAAIFAFYLWTTFYTPSWNGTPWVINSEMFDQNTRSLGQASAAANNWLWNFMIARFTAQMFNTLGYGVYMFFASLMIISAFFVFFCIPETKSIPLESMDKLFATKPVWRANGIIMDELHHHGHIEGRHNFDGENLQGEKGSLEQVETKSG